MKMKKFGAVLLAGCLLCVGAQAIPEQNQSISIVASAVEADDGLIYSVYEDHAVVAGMGDAMKTEENVNLIIPDTLTNDGIVLPVTEIGEIAFMSKKNIVSVHLGANMKTLGLNAFKGCSALTSVEFNEGLETIGSYAFRETALETLTLPDSVETIGKLAFDHCENLTSIHLGAGMKTIGQQAFSGCSALTTLELNEGLETINWGFDNCSALETVTLPSTLSTLTGSTFYGCKNLKTVNFLGGNDLAIRTAFVNCSALETVTMGEGIIEISDGGVFSGGKTLKNIQLPSTLKKIGSSAFYACTGLTEIEISAGVETIGNSAFSGCSNLETITFLGMDTPGDTSIPKKTVIRGYEGSAVQAFAEENGYTFELIGGEPDSSEPSAEEFKLGDVNEDGEIDILDVIAVNKAILGKMTLTDDQSKAADVNGSGTPDPVDSLMILKYIVNLITSFTE